MIRILNILIAVNYDDDIWVLSKSSSRIPTGSYVDDDVGQLVVVGNAACCIVLVVVLSQLMHDIGQLSKAHNPK